MPNLEIIKNLYASFAAGDVEGVLAAMRDDIVWNEAENFPYADSNPYVGPQAVLEGVFARCIGEWDGFAANMTTFFDAGDHIIATGRYAGQHKISGKSMQPQAVHIWTLKDGEITHFQQHIDTLAVDQAIS
ncbi:nuclear transport factor 2 family protein [Aestuariibacter salexigens]|uniref:nuclear transport factor 2 family protein n=1 Tax=Aestuariibacter salexigens TaxID=226010 RepID=UPI00041C9AB1|nr:nuclear transport factor 2 family protein [Aestuariibacter salexigens]